MKLVSLAIKQVRNLADVHILPSIGVNIVHGENAAGKTAILESIHLLSKARSFRTSHIRDVIQHDQDELSVSGLIENGDNKRISTGIRKSVRETQIKYNEEYVKTVSQQAKNIVIQTAIPEHSRILTGSPKERRKWIDWALFHVEHDYLKVWHDYHYALRNRNALLKRFAKEEEFFVWEKRMATAAGIMYGMWKKYLVSLQRHYHEIARENIYMGVVLRSKKNMDEESFFLEHLQSTRKHDMKVGFTQRGPHQADFEFKKDGRHIRAVFSRGQIKLFIMMLSIAQARLLKTEKQIVPIFLVDDIGSELDEKKSTMLLELFLNEAEQLFLTTIDPTSANFATTLNSADTLSLFHVKQGQVQ